MMTRLLMIAWLTLLMPLGGCVSDLVRAAKDGDMSVVRSLLDQGVEQEDKSEALVKAVGYEHSEIVQLLLEKGADVNYENGHPLRYAAADGKLEMVRLLLDRGAEINRKDSYGRTPLIGAAYWGHARVVELLLERGADPRESGYGGEKCKQGTALQCAENKGNVGVAKILQQAEVRLGQARPSSSSQVAAAPPVSAPAPAAPVITSDVDRVPTLGSPKKKNAYAVVIGIEQYREKLPRADFADRDAKLVGEYLTKVMGYPEENVIVQVNERATGRDLEKYFESWLPNNVEKDGSVFVYYSGHGSPSAKTGEAYLVPYDGDPGFLETTGYPLKRLYAALDKLPAKDVTVVLDSCFSGAGGRSVIAQGLRPMGLSVEKAMKAPGKTIVLSASSGEQVSSTYLDQGHGLMTYFFLKGLQGEGDTNHDGVIELSELFEYVKPNVQRIARKQYNNEQTPQLLASPDILKKGGGRVVEGVKR